jgi:hypothetical protein
MIQVSRVEGRLDLCFRIHQISYRRFPQNDGGDEALWLVPAFLPAASPARVDGGSGLSSRISVTNTQ